VDTSAHKASRYPHDLVEYMRGPGKRKVLFGTNFPMLTPVQCLEGLNQLGLSEEECRMFLSGNAERVFRLSAASRADARSRSARADEVIE
jgi:predicted TIM-barrel fold metal-dependent hydrolase